MNSRFYGAFRTVNSIERSQENRWVNCNLDAIMGKFSIKIMCQIKKLFRLPSLQAISLRGYSGYQVVNIWALKKRRGKKLKDHKKNSTDGNETIFCGYVLFELRVSAVKRIRRG